MEPPANPGRFRLSPDAFDSPGLVGSLSGGGPSSGSIIAVPVPEPSTALLVGLGLLGLAVSGRRLH